jgi:peptide/nickel transport system permease protein
LLLDGRSLYQRRSRSAAAKVASVTRVLRLSALFLLGGLYLSALFAPVFLPGSYDVQHREFLNEPPGTTFLLGTDELGRDRFVRLLYGVRTSLLLAPAAALLSTLIAAATGTAAGVLRGKVEKALLYITDLMVATPLIFLLLTLRALLPLDTTSGTSVIFTFLLLGATGWGSGVRVVSAAAGRSAGAGYVLQARAFGCSRSRLFLRQLIPNILPTIVASFWLSVPAFVMAEATLSMLGLGVTEPLPSLGNLVAELLNYAAVAEQPWIAAPAVLLFLILSALRLALADKETV